jgi:hypothetical protein
MTTSKIRIHNFRVSYSYIGNEWNICTRKEPLQKLELWKFYKVILKKNETPTNTP